jgi:hypothetical protein
MKVTRTSIITGITRTVDLPITFDQLLRYEKGELLQNVFPDLTPNQREFIKTGITENEWDETFKNKKNENNDK